MGVGNLIATAPSAEITTFDYGHFNSWPVTVDPTQVNGGSVDWGRAGIAPGHGLPVARQLQPDARARSTTPRTPIRGRT